VRGFTLCSITSVIVAAWESGLGGNDVQHTAKPLLSVLVPVWKERRHITTLVAFFRALDYQPRELVLCAGGPDGSYEEALRHAADDIIVLEQHPGEGKQRALERSFQACRGALLFLSDADARLAEEAISATLAPILAGEVEAATGTREPLPELRSLPIIAYQWALEVAGNAAIPDSSPGMLGSNTALTRQAALRAGSFNWEARTGTDYVLACKLRQVGVSIRFVRTSRMPVGLATNLRDYSRQALPLAAQPRAGGAALRRLERGAPGHPTHAGGQRVRAAAPGPWAAAPTGAAALGRRTAHGLATTHRLHPGRPAGSPRHVP